MKKLLFLAFLSISTLLSAQHAKRFTNYRAEREKINNLVHTKLDVSFDFDKSQLNGKAWITAKPHFYPTDKLTLDAKAMLIHKVQINGVKAPYNYTDDVLTISLGKTYKKDQEYTVFIEYTARPEYVKAKGSQAITDAKGLYFIDPKDEDPNKPTQVWTQGETEASSCWFPTIDSPNQKTTQELSMTVPSKYVTLSNGTLINQKTNSDGTRTDTWKQDQKHAPYLFFMGVGDFAVVKDTWKGKEVNYYVEKEYEPYAKTIFGMTPRMLTFFSDLTGIEYPWDKYSQIVCRDYVSGAMENTTAVIFGESAQQKTGQLVDENTSEATIAHELFHHWFGDLVTTESWANLTVNESFANYSEYLWFEHAYGKDFAEHHLFGNTDGYKMSQSENKNLVRFYYEDKEDMFDAVSYNKGGHILHMLRSYLGDDAFFAGLNKYLKDNMYGTGEAHQLRLAMEAVSGRDLNWFFNQWYFGNGHIKMTVSYNYDELSNSVAVTIKQSDKDFEFPLQIKVYEKNGIATHDVWVNQKEQTFNFNYTKKPELVTVNSNGVLLADVNDKKTTEEYAYQYENGKSYYERRIALDALVKDKGKKVAQKAIVKALNDPFFRLRAKALKNIDLSNIGSKGAIVKTIENIARNDQKNIAKAEAVRILGKLINPKYKTLFDKALASNSNAMLSAGLESMYYLDKPTALAKAKQMDLDTKNRVANVLARIYIKENDTSELPFLANHVLKGMFLTQDADIVKSYRKVYDKISESDNKEAIINLTNDFVKLGNQYKQYNFDKMALQFMRQMADKQQATDNANKKELIQIIKTAMTRLVD